METILDSSKVYMKCPTCSNPYSVDPLDIVTPQPTFDCFDCGTRFYFQWPQAFPGTELETYSLDVPVTLPEVTEELTRSETRSGTAPVPVEPVKPAKVGTVDGSWPSLPVEKKKFTGKVLEEDENDLQEKWRVLLNHWEDEWWHQSFLSACDKKARLSFASGRYAQYLQNYPEDEMARRMRERLKALSRSDLINVHKSNSASSAVQRPTFEFMALLRWWWTACLLVCLVLFMIGYTQPEYRNLIGLSLALAVFTGGVKYFFLPDPKR